jgi:hypothetical protein
VTSPTAPSSSGAGRRPDGDVGRGDDLGVEHVTGQVDVHRAGAPAARDRERTAQHVDDEVGPVDADRPLRDRREHAVGVDLLCGAALGVDCRAAAGQDDQRQAADVGLGHAGEQVRRAGPGGDQADAGLAGQLGVGGGHRRGGLLVADEHVADLRRVVERVVDRQHVAARQAEHVAHALGGKHVDDGAPCGDPHEPSPRVGVK